jgi:hypothetical protein
MSGRGEKLGTARSVHAAAEKSALFESGCPPWDRVGCPQFFAGSAKHQVARRQ